MKKEIFITNKTLVFTNDIFAIFFAFLLIFLSLQKSGVGGGGVAPPPPPPPPKRPPPAPPPTRSLLAAYNRLLELDASGEKPLYRPREWRALERARERRKRRDNWFRKGDFNTVIFVSATPGSQLKCRYMREIKATEFKIKVVEQSGTTLKAMLQRSDPFKQILTAFSAGLTEGIMPKYGRYIRVGLPGL